jgi:hypothetical protein
MDLIKSDFTRKTDFFIGIVVLAVLFTAMFLAFGFIYR